VINDFWQEFENYKTFVQELGGTGFDVVQRCELTYVNIIPPNEVFANPAQFMNVLPPIASLSDIQTDDRQMAGLDATVTYRVNEALHINLVVRVGRRANTNELVATLELTAYGVPRDLSLEGTRSWYDSAHEATYRMFLDATDKEVQRRIWKPL
jgi:uncharacterized protein (TIGR04255 family)